MLAITILWAILVFIAFGLNGCGGGGGGALPPPAQQTINPLDYLVASRYCDGNLATPLHRDDPITCRRWDFGHHQASDNFLLRDGSVITTWGYAPFERWHPPHDGGERLVSEGQTIRIDSTEDGGTPFVTQFFVGRDCGGTGWVAFRNDANREPSSLVARLNISRGNPHACSANSQAFTRYWTADVNYPKLGVIPTIIGEHYNSGDQSRASALERMFWARGWGRLVWQAFQSNPLVTFPDLHERCPDFGYNAGPTSNLRLVDCRVSVNLFGTDGSLTGAQLWHPR